MTARVARLSSEENSSSRASTLFFSMNMPTCASDALHASTATELRAALKPRPVYEQREWQHKRR